MRGRRAAGPQYVQKLPGSALVKERAEVILETLAGRCSVQQACARLGIKETRFHQLRDEFLRGALAALEPGQAGRPRQEATPETERIQALERTLAEKELELHEAQVREEVALILPHAVQAEAGREPEKKTRRQRRKRP